MCSPAEATNERYLDRRAGASWTVASQLPTSSGNLPPSDRSRTHVSDSGAILVDAVGIEVAGHPIADFFSLTMDQVFTLSFHDPEPFRIDPPPSRQPRRPSPPTTAPPWPSTPGRR